MCVCMYVCKYSFGVVEGGGGGRGEGASAGHGAGRDGRRIDWLDPRVGGGHVAPGSAPLGSARFSSGTGRGPEPCWDFRRWPTLGTYTSDRLLV